MTDYYYKCLPRRYYEHGDYTLEAVQPEHIEKIRIWRNEQMDVLRQPKPILKEQQIQYYEKHIWSELKSNQPKNILLSYKHQNILIGYGGLVNLSWVDKRGEMSFLLDSSIVENDNHRNIYMSNFITLVKNICFNQLSFNRLYTETFEFRKFHIKVLCNNGFKEEGCMRQHVYVDNQYYDSILHSIIKDVAYG
ncbi:MAG: GNAT family N-acetyltransferase [Candidatus Marinimicrobia bacterium]|jgi:RimJ/RimL family protein N-acetyltransferase|nr:GNAT family N-acetyltransferase [Candidatus Neomarinimicrobiota bacterium]